MAGKSKRPPPGGAKPKAEPTDTGPEEVSLEEFFVACQKSLARSVRSAQQASKSDSEFAQGERPIYMISGLEFNVNAGVRVTPRNAAGGGERVLLNFGLPAEQRSSLRFRVDLQATELLSGAKLELANLDPLGQESPDARLRVWLVDDLGRPVPKHDVRLYFARAGDKVHKDPILVKTDAVGRVDFFVDAASDTVKIVGDRKRRELFLRGSGRGRGPDEYFVWAMADTKPEWCKVVEPGSPCPPLAIRKNKTGEPKELCSELLRLRIE